MSEKKTSNELSITWARALTALVILGALTAMWSVFQWGELLVSRAGGTPFCALDATFDCGKVWDSSFAASVHSITRVPIAGWGVVWGLVALLAPLLTLYRAARGQAPRGTWAATLLIAVAGAGTVVVMIIASVAAGAACLSCIGSYILVGGYVGVTWFARKEHSEPWKRGAIYAVAATYATYLLLLAPGMRTPSASESSGADALATVAQQAASQRSAAQQGAANPAAHPPHPGHEQHAGATQPSAAKADPNSPLSKFLATLSPSLKQGVSDSLSIYAGSPSIPPRPPRALVGAANAPVRITDFTDILCGHCAQLHGTLEELRNALPADMLAIESRQYPLDSECNPTLSSPPRYPVRCLAARARICLEKDPRFFEFSAALFEHQNGLSPEKIYSIAAPFMEPKSLQACVMARETQVKLNDDIRWAQQHNLDGTPLVLVNGRKATSFGPFLYALALANLNPKHPDFAALPAPRHNAHMH